MLTLHEVLGDLEAHGSEQTRKTYRRYGVQGEMFGVNYGPLNAMKKKLKVNHPLARDLWATGNHDARVLATMIADLQAADGALLEAWASALDS